MENIAVNHDMTKTPNKHAYEEISKTCMVKLSLLLYGTVKSL